MDDQVAGLNKSNKILQNTIAMWKEELQNWKDKHEELNYQLQFVQDNFKNLQLDLIRKQGTETTILRKLEIAKQEIEDIQLSKA